MKKTQHDRKAFIDHLERKYIKKIQHQAFQKEGEDVKRSLFNLRGRRVERFRQTSDIDSPISQYRLHYL